MAENTAKPSIDIKDDLHQAVIVGKYETIKFFSGKKIYIFGGLIILVAALIAILFTVFPDDVTDTKTVTATFVSFDRLGTQEEPVLRSSPKAVCRQNSLFAWKSSLLFIQGFT